MQNTETHELEEIDLVQSEPAMRVAAPTPTVIERLHSYGILPPGHEKMPEATLLLVEQIFVTWYELADDDSRRRSLRYLIGTEQELRATLLAIVPLYFDPLYFDELTPTRDLVELALVAHRKWRAWLDQAATRQTQLS